MAVRFVGPTRPHTPGILQQILQDHDVVLIEYERNRFSIVDSTHACPKLTPE